MQVNVLNVSGFYEAVLAARLPKKSAEKSDSHIINDTGIITEYSDDKLIISSTKNVCLGKKDIELVKKLVKAGDEHAKVLRGVIVWMEIEAPRYLHSELDTYKVGAERLSSESTMHCECKTFKGEELQKMKGDIKESHIQKRIWTFSYQSLRRLRKQRRHHRLPEWHMICDAIESLPLASDWIMPKTNLEDRLEQLEMSLRDCLKENADLKNEILNLKKT